MPPSSLNSPQTDPNRMLPAHEKSGLGPTVGIIIILVLMLFGGLYFWGAYLNKENTVDQIPFIPDNSTGQTG